MGAPVLGEVCMKQSIKLEVGKTYTNLSGHQIKIVRVSSDGRIFYDSPEGVRGLSYFANGELVNCDRTSWDLVREISNRS